MSLTNHFNIVLVEPEIPQNTGNIVRLCSCTNSKLFLVGKLGFQLSDKYLKRAGLDYWDEVNITLIPSLEELMSKYPENNFYFFSTKAQKKYTDISYKNNDFLVFGSETRGLPADFVLNNLDNAVKLPMVEGKRSLNLANTASIALYEALRQIEFWG